MGQGRLNGPEPRSNHCLEASVIFRSAMLVEFDRCRADQGSKMERDSLKAVFSEAAASNWCLETDVQLQHWLESFSKQLVERTDRVAEQVHKLVEETFSVEQDLRNTFNQFRSLSDSQFIENRVYEEDETSSPIAEAATKQHSDAVIEDYEGGIVPRYKEAALTAWRVLEESKIASKHAIFSESDGGSGKEARWRLPFVVGTDEFFRDVKCGLSDPQRERLFSGVSAPDSDTESHSADLIRERVDKVFPSEVESSDSSDVQNEGLEPAVSAALDFKAMLEAALRGPSVSYGDDGVTVPNYGTSSTFLGKVDDVNAIWEDPRSLDLLQRTMSENRKHNNIPIEDDEGSGASSNPGTSSNRIPSLTLGRQNAPSSSSSSIKATEEVQDADYPYSEFPITSTVGRNHIVYEAKPPFVGNADESVGYQSSAGDKMVKASSSLPNFPSTSMEYTSPGLGPLVVPGSITEPTVPEVMFRSSQQSSKPESSSGKFSYMKGTLQEPAFVRGITAQSSQADDKQGARQEQQIITTNQEPDDSRVTSSQVTRKATTANPPLKQFQGGLFDEDDNEDDSYVAHLMKQQVAASNANRSVRSWSRIGAGKGLFDENDSKSSSPEDAKGSSAELPRGSVTAYGDDTVPAPEAASHLDLEYLQRTASNSLLATTLAGRNQQRVATEDDTVSLSSTDESHTGSRSNTSLNEGLASTKAIPPSQIQSVVEKPKGGSQTTFMDVSRAGMHQSTAYFLDATSNIDTDATQMFTTADQYKGEGRRSVAVEAASVEAASLLSDDVEQASQKESSGRRYLLFGDSDDDDDETIFETKRGLHLQQDSEAPDVGVSEVQARHPADQTGRPWDNEPPTTDRLSPVAKPPGLTQQPTAARSKSVGSAYLSSILFGDEEENEDELFGSFLQGPSKTRSALDPLFGKRSRQLSSFQSDDLGSDNASSKLALDVAVAANSQPQVTRRSLFDD